MTVALGELKPGTKIRWPYRSSNPDHPGYQEGWVIEFHESSGRIRVAMEEGSNSAHWAWPPEKLVEVIE